MEVSVVDRSSKTTAMGDQVRSRARDRLWVSGVKPVSEFLDDLVDTRHDEAP